MTDAITIVHAADFHLDSSFAGLSPQRASQRRAEQRELLGDVFALAERKKADVILLAGDLLDSDNAYYETTEQLRQLCRNCSARIFISPGNHDYFSQSSPYGAMVWPDNVHIFRSTRISAVEIPELNLRVYGAAFNRADSPALMEGFTAQNDGMINIMVIHGERGGATYNPISDEQIESSGLDYLALGHTHSYSGINKLGDTYWAYPGCPEGRGFDETGDKGVIAGAVSKDGVKLDFIPVSRRRYEIRNIDLTGSDDHMQTITESLPDDTYPDIYRLVLTGETEDAPNVEVLTTAFENRFYGLQIRDRTSRLVSIWDGENEQTLRGEFLTRLRKRWNSASTDEEKQQIELAVRFGLAALDRKEAPGA